MTWAFSMSANKINLYCILGAFVQRSEINLILLDKKTIFRFDGRKKFIHSLQKAIFQS